MLGGQPQDQLEGQWPMAGWQRSAGEGQRVPAWACLSLPQRHAVQPGQETHSGCCVES